MYNGTLRIFEYYFTRLLFVRGKSRDKYIREVTVETFWYRKSVELTYVKTFSAAELSISGTNYPNGYEAPYQSMILRTNSTISAVIWKIKRLQSNY